MVYFKQIKVVLVCTSCLLEADYKKQHLNVRDGHLEID